ncbi:helix-turn-helix domain-containing protein [bacterium]|nr:helix-turn-helix domain-containing protein [bacterium]MCB2179323.1 helix-turn-helix domain-containing protein [bacterium]
MKQPDLGLRVSELRQQKGFTQEKLAELCEVSTRTIQRIEAGEVDPRSFTINRLNEVLDFDFGTGELEDENIWLAALHFSNIVGFLLMSLIVWSINKRQSYKIDQHGRAVINFQLTLLVLLVVLVFAWIAIPILVMTITPAGGYVRLGKAEFVIMGVVFPFILVGFISFYQGVKNIIRVFTDKPYHYPWSIKFIK